jgi:glycosyltransferase involved in cell wall biosynthesis
VPRVLHCPTTVGGHPQGLAAAERRLGLESRSVAFAPDPYGYPVDEVLFEPGRGVLRWELRRWSFLREALRDYDVIHFNFGTTIAPTYVPRSARALTPNDPTALGLIHGTYARLLELRDLPLLRRAGKTLVVTFQGGDARQGDYSKEHFEVSYATEVPVGFDSAEYDERKRWRISAFDRYAHHIFALNPDLLHVLPQRAKFLPYASVDINEWTPVIAEPGQQRPLVVHAPTDRHVKGTRFLDAAIEQLRVEGVDFEYVEVSGVTRSEARRVLERADLVVDQLLAGWYGGLAVEAMALGKPVLAYIREGDLAFVPTQMRADLPLIQARPDTVTDVLREWLTSRRGELPVQGRLARAFVERWHDPLRVAEETKAVYERATTAA